MYHTIVHKSSTYQLALAYASNILVITLTTYGEKFDIVYELQLLDDDLPIWIESEIGNIESLYKILTSRKETYEVVTLLGLIRFFLDENKIECNEIPGPFVLKLPKKSQISKEIVHCNNLSSANAIQNQAKSLNTQSQSQHKNQRKLMHWQGREEQLKKFQNLPFEIEQLDRKSQSSSSYQIQIQQQKNKSSQFSFGEHNREKNLKSILLNDIKKSLKQDKDDKNEMKQKGQTKKNVLKSFFANNKGNIFEIQLKNNEEVNERRVLRSHKAQLPSHELGQAIKKQTNQLYERSRQKIPKQAQGIQQIKKFKLQLCEIKNTVDDMKGIILNQQKKIQQLEQEIFLLKNQKRRRRRSSTANPKLVYANYQLMKSETMIKWNINRNFSNIMDFDVNGLTVTYMRKNNEWGYVFLENEVGLGMFLGLTIKIHKCLEGNIAFGITYEGNAIEGACWKKKETFEYVGFSNNVFGDGRYLLTSGNGIWQGATLRMNVNSNEGRIQWRSDRGIEASIESNSLKKNNIKYVPYVRFKNFGDCVQFVGNP